MTERERARRYRNRRRAERRVLALEIDEVVAELGLRALGYFPNKLSSRDTGGVRPIYERAAHGRSAELLRSGDFSRTAPQSPSAQSGKTIKGVYLTRSGLSIGRRSTAASSVRRRI